jgi:hypothetical protein
MHNFLRGEPIVFPALTIRQSRNESVVAVRNATVKKPASRGCTPIRTIAMDASVPNDCTLYTAIAC